MKVYDDKLREQIRILRQQGLTYSEINKNLSKALPKSTLSHICRNIDPGDEYHKRIKEDTLLRLPYIQKLAVAKNRQIFDGKLMKISHQSQYASKLIKDVRVAKIALAMLYLGEGAKWKSRRGPMLGSSDPKTINTYINLLRECYSVQVKDLRGRIQHRADQDKAQLLTYWSNVTGITPTHFYPNYVDKRTVGKTTAKPTYRGVCAITCPGTYIQLELQIIADIINETWGCSSVD